MVVELAREADRMQAEDRARLERFRAASQPFLREFQAAGIAAMRLPEAHQRIVELAVRTLPLAPLAPGDPQHGTAQ